MLKTYNYPKYEFNVPVEISKSEKKTHPVVVIGAGPVGLAAAIDLAQMGLPVVLVDEDDTVSRGSRGVCYAKRTLEVLDRLGVGDACVSKGISWNVGKSFFQDDEIYRFKLNPEPDHKRPGMINLQQYYLEEYLVRRAKELPLIDLRFKSKVTAINNEDSAKVQISVCTPIGEYILSCDWLVVADGAHSNIRKLMGLDVRGKVFTDRFLIADVVMKADFPAERWFWFDPPFHRGQSVLLHKQADDVWRIDFQLGWQANPEEEKKPERVIPRIRAMLGDERPFELEWVSVYTFQCRRMEKFRHGRVLFVGDAAHQVSPFGARGANSGLQDSDNLCWKLAAVINAQASEKLLDSYSDERTFAADENMLNSTRSTDFITPKSPTSLMFRNAVLDLSRDYPFARALVNSGRLSVPTYLINSSLNTDDCESFLGDMCPGSPMVDAPIIADNSLTWLLDLVGNNFQLLLYVANAEKVNSEFIDALKETITINALTIKIIIAKTLTKQSKHIGNCLKNLPDINVVVDSKGCFAKRYDAKCQTNYLIRPDQHVCARWRALKPNKVKSAILRAMAN